MAQAQVHDSCGRCDSNGKQVNAPEEKGDHQTQCKSSADSWLVQVTEGCNPRHETRQPSTNVCIFRVPKVIRDSNPKAYLPLVVSLGPFHHNVNPKLSAMDEHKIEAVRRTMTRLKGVTLESLIAEIKNRETDIRDCYEDSAIEWNGEMLVWMMVMDACFILEYIRSYVQNRTNDINSFSLVFRSGEHLNQVHWSIIIDIMKLENQIPLFILITLLQLECNGNREDAVSNLADMLSGFKEFRGNPFSSQFSGDEVKSRVEEHIEKGACHLLDLHRRVIKNILTQSSGESTSPTQYVDANSSRSTPRAELLQKVGIKFKLGQIGFQKRSFGASMLSLPQISVSDGTESRLRNLVAFEECQRCSWSPHETVISRYVHFMNDMIDSEKDVSIFTKSVVVQNFVGSEEDIANMFNHLGKGITLSPVEQFEIVGKDASEHYNSLLTVWVNQFKEEHCSRPWYILSLVAGLMILVMTAMQTYNSF